MGPEPDQGHDDGPVRSFRNMSVMKTLHAHGILTVLVFAASLLATFTLWNYAQRQADYELSSEFESHVHDVTSHLEQRMAAYVQVLYGLRGMFRASEQVTRDEFRAYTSSLQLEQNYPGIQGLSHAPLVSHDQKARHIAEIRAQGFPDYSITPQGERDYYTPVMYIEPFSGRNTRVLGYDTFHEAERHATMVEARDSDRPAVSGKLTLMQESNRNVQSGFLVFLPLYSKGMPHDSVEERRASIYGWVTAVFRMGDLMAGLGNDHIHSYDLSVEIYDGAGTSDQARMYASHDTDTSHSSGHAMFSTVETIRFPNHSWTLVIRSTPEFLADFANNTPTLVATAGVAFTLLLTVLAHALVRSSRITHELVTSEERWRFALEGAGDGVWDWNIASNEVKYSSRWKEMLGYTRKEISDRFSEFESRIHPDDLNAVRMDIQAHLDGKTPTYINEHRAMHKDGSWRWILDRGMVTRRSGDGSPLRMIGVHTDITGRKRDENETRAQRDFTNAVVEAAGNVIVVLDASGNIVRFNRTAEELTGFQRNEVIGKPVWEFFIPKEQEAGVKQVFENLKAGNTTIAGRYKNDWLKRDGSRATLDWHNTILRNDKGAITHIVALGYDITEQIRDEDKIRRLSRLYSSLSHCDHAIVHSADEHELFPQICKDAVNHGGFSLAWIGVLDGKGERVNPVACHGPGSDYLEDIVITVDPEDPTGKGPASTAIRENRPVWCQEQEGPSSSKWHAFAQRYGWKASASLPLRTDGKVVGIFGLYARETNAFDADSCELLQQMATDISFALEGYAKEKRRKLAEDELQKLNANLESMVKDRTEELSRAKELADSASQAKSEFLSNMSHEIRTPLAAIIGFSKTLRDDEYDDDERGKLINRIVRNGEHLQQIVSDILDLSKIESGQLDIEQVNTSPYALIADIDSQLGLIAADKGLAFEFGYQFPLPKLIVTDPTCLKQILINLCSNAIKFTASGFVRIEVSCDSEYRQIRFDVTDSGIGMNQDEINCVFDPFTQADTTTTRKFGGTGLGLPISSRLTEALGGELCCESQKGKGSRFTLSLPTNLRNIDPVNSMEEIEMLMHQSPTDNVEIRTLSGRILLVDDNPDNRELIELYVQKTGANIDIAKNGREGVEMASGGAYDLIFMDMQMPVMDGVEAIKLLRKNGYQGPIVSLTANAMLSNREECLSAGANDYLVKPVNLSMFYDTLNRYLTAAVASDDAKDDGERDISSRSDAFYSSPGYMAIVERFKKKLPALIEELSTAVNSEAWDVVQSKSHDLKGMGGTMGFAEITEVAAKLNHLVKEKDYKRVIQANAELANQCQAIIRGR